MDFSGAVRGGFFSRGRNVKSIVLHSGQDGGQRIITEKRKKPKTGE